MPSRVLAPLGRGAGPREWMRHVQRAVSNRWRCDSSPVGGTTRRGQSKISSSLPLRRPRNRGLRRGRARRPPWPDIGFDKPPTNAVNRHPNDEEQERNHPHGRADRKLKRWQSSGAGSRDWPNRYWRRVQAEAKRSDSCHSTTDTSHDASPAPEQKAKTSHQKENEDHDPPVPSIDCSDGLVVLTAGCD